MEPLEPRYLLSASLPTPILDLLTSRLDDPATTFTAPTVIDASTTALNAEFNTYYTALDEQVWRANINGDSVVNTADLQLFNEAVAGTRSDIVAIDVPDGTHSFSLQYDDAGVVDEVYDDWLEPLFTRYGLTYDPADDPAYADLFAQHIPTFFYANLAHTTWGKGYAFLGEAYRTDGPIDATTVPDLEIQSPVVIQNLGVYDSETGDYIFSNYDGGLEGCILIGRYLQTGQLTWTGTLPVPELVLNNNDFRFEFRGDGQLPYEYSHIWASQVNMYFHIDRFRTTYFTDVFIQSLDLNPDIETNLRVRQYRLGGYSNGSDPATIPLLNASEGRQEYSANGVGINPIGNNVDYGIRTRRLSGGSMLPIVSNSFDRGLVVGEYAGLIPFWISPNNNLYPVDAFVFQQHPLSMTAVVNDSVNYWAAYRYTGDSELWRSYSAGLRSWEDRPVGGDGIPWFRGRIIGDTNSMMYDENNVSGDQVYPFENNLPGGITDVDYPWAGDRTGLFLAALWYEMANDGGLGDVKTDMIVWKTLSMIPDLQTFSMRQFGDLMLDAAAALWPDAGDPGKSIYHDILVQVMASRGIATGGAVTFHDNLPDRVGSEGTLDIQSSSAFGTTHPDMQADMSLSVYNYNNKRIFRNGYTAPDTDYSYMSYTMFKHSKYGPGDKVLFSDGTFKGIEVPFADAGEWNEDGGYQIELEGRELGNITLMVPGSEVDWVRHRNRVATESVAASTIDVHAFGWIATQSMKNGFSIEVQRVGEDATTVTYEVSIVDPSLAMVGGLRTGPAVYDWAFANYLGESMAVDGDVQPDGGLVVQYVARRDEPFELAITRTRNGIVDVLNLIERGNDFDRDGGEAFYVDAVNLPTVALNNQTAATETPGFGGTVDDPDAVVEVWIGTDPVLTYQTAAVYKATNHGDGTWSLPGGLIDALPNGTYDVHVRATAAGKLSVIDHSVDELTINVPTLQGDLDGDGFVGIADLNLVLGNWNQNVAVGDWSLGDPSGDGFVGIEDLNAVLGNWNAGTPPLVEAIAMSASISVSIDSASVQEQDAIAVSGRSKARHYLRDRIGQARPDPKRTPHQHDDQVSTDHRASLAAWSVYQRRAFRAADAGVLPVWGQADDTSVELGLWEAK